ncbi:MAG: cobyrinate a,c-diamide synthase [Deltaproteobacteria bacterium]|jgi:cobyrinic acid a,c-diamide synthase|nr:cobyrinate a,c-diamide synthase [Deltaproteobacteria bacterium]
MLVSAPASGHGKTTVTAALARRYRKAGLRVRVFKCGPDFLDPTILARASGNPVYQLDLFMVGLEGCRELLWKAAAEADLIIVEGVMGLFDGNPSAADLAEKFGLPILALIDARAMAQTFGAVAYGLLNYRPGLNFFGVLANRVAGDSHAQLLKDSLPPKLKWYGALRRGGDLELPSRHLGLVQASELTDLDRRLDLAAGELERQTVSELPPKVAFAKGERPERREKLFQNLRIAIARDQAFSFIYQANLDLMVDLGAELHFFSPIKGDRLPAGVNALYLPGGYPELHLGALSENRPLIMDIAAFHFADKPILAECGGLLYLLKKLTYKGVTRDMVGLLPGEAVLTDGLKGLGMMEVDLPEGSLRGHSFHHSELTMDLEPLCLAKRADGRNERLEVVYRKNNLTASYVHFYFPSNPKAAAALFSLPQPGAAGVPYLTENPLP